MKIKANFLIALLSLFALISTALACYISIAAQNAGKECRHESIDTKRFEATCSSEGKTLHSCKSCAYCFVTDVTPTLPHSYFPKTVEATCLTSGYTVYSCECGDFYIDDITPPTTHDFSSSTIAPTCISSGYTEHICRLCAYSYKDSYTERTEHSYKSRVYLPTALSAGYTEHICACSDSYTDSEILYSEIASLPYVEGSAVLAKGIDVSRWNHQIDSASGEYLPLDWKKIKAAGYDFVIIKAGSTRTGKEPTFELDYEGARAAGLMVGAYYYTYSSTVEQTLADAEKLLEYLDGKQLEYPIYFDLEDTTLIPLGADRLTELCESFICFMQKNGYYSALYTNNNWLRNILNTSKILSLFDIWYARYPNADAPVWNEEKYGKQLSMWQYTQTGELEGLEGYFDLNYCYRDYPSIMKRWGLNGFNGDLTK